MKDQIKQLKATFHEIFQTDQAELDFGIYRIMRQKRDEFDAYLETQLLTDLRLSFRKWQTQTGEDLQRQLTEAVNGAIQLGFDPDASPKVKELRETLEAIKHRESLEEGVLSDLVQFLGRYYREGDFLSLPRYRKNSYAIEYNGEEVKLHWANADQYYVKTAERFRDYRFLLPDGKAVHFKIKTANTETGNNKAETGKERRFQLIEDEFMREENGELLIFFRYEIDPEKRKQAEINTESARRIWQETEGLLEWRKALSELAPTPANKDRRVLDKHLSEYTARNTFDYFIHKDLEAFLRRELDFYIKNEIVRLDDIENEDAPRVELYLAKVKALRRIGHKLISFLAQVENFQKKLFLKKKFVIRANYCLTLDRVPRELWPDVIANAAQLEEWRRLYAIDEIEGAPPDGDAEAHEQFLEANQNLIVDTRHFSEEWKLKLLASFDDLDAATDGVLIKADNFHALNLLRERYRESVKCIYIDPPYNTEQDRATGKFLYKDGYAHSSWLAMAANRLDIAKELMSDEGVTLASIDDNELNNFRLLMNHIFKEENSVSLLTWEKGRKNDSTYFSESVEYILIHSKNKQALSAKGVWREKKLGADKVLSAYADLRASLGDNHSLIETRMRAFYRSLHKDDPAKKLRHFNRSDDRGLFFGADISSASTSIPDYEVFHPVTHKPVKKPERGWGATEEEMLKRIADNRVLFGEDETTIPLKRSYLFEVDSIVKTPVLYKDGRAASKVVEEMFNFKSFPNPKDAEILSDLISYCTSYEKQITVLDFFAGSGTTAHAVIKLNREDDGRRKYLLVETNEYFDSVTLPRVKKVIYAKEWKDGKPTTREGSPHLLKYFALESYEDAMNNLSLSRTPEQEQGLLKFTNEFREDYLLNYMLEFEAHGSQSLLNLDNFAAPFNYRMNIAVSGVGETQATPVDLVETFNYLLGLHVERTQQIDGFRVVRGTTRKGERCLILWRTIKDLAPELADKRLNDFLEKQSFDFSEIDTLYLNGDAAIPVGNVRKETDTWQIKLIEAEFLRSMFE